MEEEDESYIHSSSLFPTHPSSSSAQRRTELEDINANSLWLPSPAPLMQGHIGRSRDTPILQCVCSRALCSPMTRVPRSLQLSRSASSPEQGRSRARHCQWGQSPQDLLCGAELRANRWSHMSKLIIFFFSFFSGHL